MPEKDIIQLLLLAILLVISMMGSFLVLQKYGKWPNLYKLFRFTNREQEFEIQLLKTQLELQEQALRNISQEIHDNIGQALTFVKLNINTIDTGKVEETKNKLAESKLLISKVIQDLRNLSRTLNADCITEAGLSASIQHQLRFLEETGLYTTRFSMSDTWCKSQADTELVLFRVVQELLNNIVKHAEATAIEVSMDCRSGTLFIGVNDNGKGFIQAAEADSCKGIGLMNMKKRISLLKGSLVIDSLPGKGTSVFITIPLIESSQRILIAPVTSRTYNSVPA
jgi:signal transduction histidine kinase